MDPLSVILGYIQQILGLEQQNLAAAQQLATTEALQQVGSDVQTIAALQQFELDQITALQSGQSVISAQITSLGTALIGLVTRLPQVGVPVTLPPVPPVGYGGASAADVWNYNASDTGDTAYENLIQIYDELEDWSANVAVRTSFAPNAFFIGDRTSESVTAFLDGPYPVVDENAILSTDSLLTWVSGQLPGWLVTDPATSDGYCVVFSPGDTGHIAPWLIDIDLVRFAEMKRALFPSLVRATAPVWPGEANVVFGTPVALSSLFSITEPMDGVVIEITSPPSGRGSYDYDGVLSYQNIGSLSFFTDDLEQEFQMALGFTTAVYCPRSMARAAGVRIRTIPGLTGTAIPWTGPA